MGDLKVICNSMLQAKCVMRKLVAYQLNSTSPLSGSVGDNYT